LLIVTMSYRQTIHAYPTGGGAYIVAKENLGTTPGLVAGASLQSIISGAADATTQGRTMGAVSGLQSLMAVLAPIICAPLLGAVSNLPRGDWRIGAPFYFCALVQFAALALAWLHFSAVRRARVAAATTPRTT